MKEYTVLARVEQLLEMLYARGRTPSKDLENRLGVSRRTIKRDVDYLRESGYVIESYTGPGGGYELQKVYMNLALSAARISRLEEIAHKSQLDETDERELQEMLAILRGGRYMNSPKIVVYHTKPDDIK